MAPASSFLISGIFLLSNGSRMANPSYYIEYASSLDFVDVNKSINVSVRKYTPPSEALYPQDTVVFLIAKAALPPCGEDGLLDVIHCTPFQASYEEIQECLPPGAIHTASVMGTMNTINNTDIFHSFTVNAFEYVRDERRGFPIQFQFEADSPRWKNLRLPPTGSPIIATGVFKGIAEDGLGEPILALLDVSFGTPEVVSTSPIRAIGHRRLRRNATPTEKSLPSSSPSPSKATTEVSSDAMEIAASTSKRPVKEVEEVEENPVKQKQSRTRNGRFKAAN